MIRTARIASLRSVWLPSNTPRLLAVGCWLLMSALSAQAQSYRVTDLGTLGGAMSEAFSINDAGLVTGRLLGSGTDAFVYDGSIHDIGTLGGTTSEGLSINNSGSITGDSSIAGTTPRHAFLFDGSMHDLGTLGGNTSFGAGINASGEIAGAADVTGYVPHAFLYDGTMHDLGTLGGSFSAGQAINNSGVVTGSSYLAGDTSSHAMIYDGTMHDLGTLGGSYSSGLSINNFGVVTGFSDLPGNALSHAMVYDGTMHDLGTLGGSRSYGAAINDAGVITGNSQTASGDLHAFVYDGTMHDMQDVTPAAAHWQFTIGNGINSASQIVGRGVNANGDTHAFLLTPYTPDLSKPFQLTSPGELTGGAFSAKSASLNNHGEVVGASATAAGSHAFIAHAGGSIQDLGTLPGGNSYSRADVINDNGFVAGTSNVGSGPNAHAFLWNPGSQTKTDLGELSAGAGAIAAGMNNAQTVVGVSAAEGTSAAFVWDSSNGMRPLAHFGYGLNNYASGINDAGQIVGYAETGHGQHAVLWNDPNSVVDLGSLSGPYGGSAARAINASGHVAGVSSTTAGLQHAFLYDGTMHDLGALTIDGNSDAYALNALGWVVGAASTPGGDHAFLWTPDTGMLDLNNLFDNGGLGWTLISASSINDRGQIAGMAVDELGNSRSFVLNEVAPVPEPPAIVLSALGMLGALMLFCQHRQKCPRRGAR